jgi:hypothetical protein
LNQGPKVHHTRHAADPLFVSAAKTHGQRVIGIVLSGGDGDGPSRRAVRAVPAGLHKLGRCKSLEFCKMVVRQYCSDDVVT